MCVCVFVCVNVRFVCLLVCGLMCVCVCSVLLVDGGLFVCSVLSSVVVFVV